MRVEKNAVRASTRWPQTRSELETWIRDRLGLTVALQDDLLTAIDVVFSRHQRLWQESKEEAIQALSTGFAEKVTRLRTELSARDATVSSIARYFEDLVAELTEKSHRDAKTKLMNFDWFMEQLEAFLELEQRVRWCAVGLVDITGFKWYNDNLGHSVGDQVIECVARLLREQARSDDLIAHQELTTRRRSPDLHARFGGDEFCFFIPDLSNAQEGRAVAERFREAVERYDWTTVEPGLASKPVRVDVGVVCLWMGRVGDRRFIAKRLSLELIQLADKLMYDAKGEGGTEVRAVRIKVENGQLVPGDSDVADPAV